MLATSNPFSLILFGASGHLAVLKLYPALYILALKKRLPKEYAIVGFARSPMTDDSFRELISVSIHRDLPEVNKSVLNDFLHHCVYHRGEYQEQKDFDTLNQRLSAIEKSKSWVRLAYLSVPPTMFPPILQNLCKGGIHCHTRKGDFRCIVEKPVGHDGQSAEKIYTSLTQCFRSEEIYLLDHYLGKEAVRNVYYLRYANPLLERLFKNTLIHHVEITALETSGLEGRAGYFDQVGTFRDMFQSHLLEIASLLTMRLHGEDSIQNSRLNALEQFYIPPATDLRDIVLQAQCEKYREEDKVSANSRTNTFACLKLMTRISRWEGVPFYLRSGKYLNKKETRISIQFQAPNPIGSGSSCNRLDIILQGEAGMRMHLQTKLGGTEPAFRPLILEDPLVCVGDCLPEHGLLLLEAIYGKQVWYLTFDEVRAAWKLIDPLQAHFEKKKTPLSTYKKGTSGPAEADAWIAKEGIGWF
ncbi:glucose-6-phosphate dehydrogenase (NADP(+)) [Candidatus Peregrinibacteria bacterium]|nr:glucose-6-phosphate dehydrogenase (NADP(+)) [Candidatus Peregrinibacteria bacterium]